MSDVCIDYLLSWKMPLRYSDDTSPDLGMPKS